MMEVSSNFLNITFSICWIRMVCSNLSASNTLMPVEIISATQLVMMVTITMREDGSDVRAMPMMIPNITKVESKTVLTKYRLMAGTVSGVFSAQLIASTKALLVMWPFNRCKAVASSSILAAID